MIGRSSLSIILRRPTIACQNTAAVGGRSVVVRAFANVPDTIKRVGTPEAFPNEYPGMIYAFNWCLNGDGVTPLKGSAFRITKPLDLQVAGLQLPKQNPLKVKAADLSKIPEAGSDGLSFETFDEVSQRTRDLISLSDHLYCPEGHVPGTRTGVRIITNSARLAPDLLAYLDRAPKKDPPESNPITAYILEGNTEEDFAGYAIEEIEVALPPKDDGKGYTKGYSDDPIVKEARSVAAIVVVGKKPDIKIIVAGIEASQKALAADEVERAAKLAAAEAAKAESS